MVELEKQNLKMNTSIYKRKLKILKKELGKDTPIDHVGSTVLPNMYGKNIIDILVGARNIEELEIYANIIKKIGFYPGKNNQGPYRFFANTKEETKKGDIHIHLALIDTDRYKDFLILKTYLLNNREERKKYSDLKKELIRDGNNLREDYKKKKALYVSNLLDRARKEVL